MNAVADAPVDTYGGLLRVGETPEHALRRLERKANFSRVIGTDEGQRLLAAATAQSKALPNGGVKARGQVQAKIEEKTHALVADAIAGNGVVTEAALAEAIASAEAETPLMRLVDLPIELVDIGTNIRIEPGELEGLAANIGELGVLQPIRAIGPDAGGRYRAVWGQRRVLASRLAKLDTIPALVEPSADVDAPGAKRSIEQLSENLLRKDLGPLEEAHAIRAVLDATKGLTQEALAQRLGRSGPWIANTLALLKAPKAIQELVRTERITAAHAKAISGLDADVAVRLAKSAAENGTSAHSLEDSAKWERRNQAERAQNARLLPDAVARGLAALEKAAIANDVAVYVVTDDWRIQDAEVRTRIGAAGYTLTDGWARTGTQRWSKCDCTAVELRIRPGDGSTVVAACVKDAHWKQLDAERSASSRQQQAADEAERKRLAPFVRAAMPAELNPTLARLILRRLGSYEAKPWAEYAKLSDEAVRKAIVDGLTNDQAVRGGYDGKGKLPIKTVLRELGAGDDETKAAPAKHPRRRPPQAVAADERTEPLACVGSNHVPGCAHVTGKAPA